MSKKTKVFEKQVTNEHGEIKEETIVQSYSIPTEEDYIKIYIKHINYIRDLPLGMEGLIYELLKKADYGNEIIINSSRKREIAKNLGKKFNTINQYITKLVDTKIIVRKDRGVYYLNPLFYGKGKWKDIVNLRKELNVNILYEDNKYNIKV